MKPSCQKIMIKSSCQLPYLKTNHILNVNKYDETIMSEDHDKIILLMLKIKYDESIMSMQIMIESSCQLPYLKANDTLNVNKYDETIMSEDHDRIILPTPLLNANYIDYKIIPS